MSKRVERFEIAIEAGPEEVWRCLTTSEGLSSWFGTESEIDFRIGGNRRIAWDDVTSFNAEITAIEPLRRIEVAYTDGGEETGAEEWLLHPDGKTTRLTLINTMSDEGIEDWDGFYGDIRRGWTLFMESMRFALEDALQPTRRAHCRAIPAPGTRESVWIRAMEPLIGHDVGMALRIEDRPHSLFFGSPERSLLLDIEGSGAKQVIFYQAASHSGDLDWSEEIFQQVQAEAANG